MPVTPIDADQIVITASRAPEAQAQTPASVTIIDDERIERLGEPLVPALLRLSPSVAVATSGPAGSLTEVRIRGAEANHTLLFVDGIKINDPAAGDQPRFELLNADLASRIEIVRGPQSALWGSEAIGGVIAINGVADAPGYSAAAEGGSFGFARATASESLVSDAASLSGAVGWQRATGVDSFNGRGDKDGYSNLSGRLRGSWKPLQDVEIGASAIALTGRSEFDGFDPVTFVHADTLDSSKNQLLAGRLWAKLGENSGPWSGQISASLLGSSNRNFLADEPINRTSGTRRNFSAQLERRFSTGPIAHTVIAAAEAERETFHARDTIYGGLSDQDRTRDHQSLTLEWRGETKRVTGDVAVRRDIFNRFRDATSLRASLLTNVGGGFAVAGSYAEGIAQPTFFDLYGFFPGSFFGNPSLKPESSRGFEASLRYRRGTVEASLTGYEQRLQDEIIDVSDPVTFLSSAVNRPGVSHRSGIEAEFGWRLGDTLRLTANYAYLHATQPADSGIGQEREVRRPKHSGAIALDGSSGRLTYGASLAYSGARPDTNFDVFPAEQVRLHAYWLAGARLAYALRPGVDLFARATNALDQHYEDVFGYRTEGRAAYIGVRLVDRRSSP
ncbi:MAG TPA: TonB-dependent receptor [Sphingomicrobium sp.]|nr:TonB-dependent receptor [Sphingomicrobium sp.]